MALVANQVELSRTTPRLRLLATRRSASAALSVAALIGAGDGSGRLSVILGLRRSLLSTTTCGLSRGWHAWRLLLVTSRVAVRGLVLDRGATP
jgi:hypothetical protein